LPRLHRKDEELAGVWFRASPKTEERCGDRTMVVKKRWLWRSVREMLKRGDAQAVEDDGVLPLL
jgi:hypothetical protein